MIEPTMIHASATLLPGRGRDMIFPPPCHFGKQAILIYDDSFSPGSLSLSYGEEEQHEAQAQKEGSGACNRDIIWI